MTRSSLIANWLLACAAYFAVAEQAAAATCSVNPQAVSFGSYDPLDTTERDGVGNINITCDAPVDFTVSLSAGSGTYQERKMFSGASHLSYNLYTDASRAVVWGDGISAGDVSASGTSVDLPVYGRIAPRQNVPAETYSDVVIVTISY